MENLSLTLFRMWIYSINKSPPLRSVFNNPITVSNIHVRWKQFSSKMTTSFWSWVTKPIFISMAGESIELSLFGFWKSRELRKSPRCSSKITVNNYYNYYRELRALYQYDAQLPALQRNRDPVRHADIYRPDLSVYDFFLWAQLKIRRYEYKSCTLETAERSY